MRPNRLRNLLRDGKPTLSTRIHSAWPSIIEIIGHTGMFDYVEFVGEYAPYDLYALDNLCRAAELFDLGMMIKLDQEPRAFLAQRAVGAGFQSVLFADARSPEDVAQCVRCVRPDTPEDGGLAGYGWRRCTYGGNGPSPEYVQALREVVVAIMIEKGPAVERLEEILAVPGVDMIQWGPADYSISVGKAGQRNSPEMRAVEKRVIETALRAGVPARAEIDHIDQARYYLDLGVRHFSLSTDILILSSWWKKNGEELRRTLES